MKKIGITMGDPAGIGPEISVKALASNEEYLNHSIIFGSTSIIDYYVNLLKLNLNINSITHPAEFKSGHINVLNVKDLSIDNIEIGKVSPIAGEATYKYIETAIQYSLNGDIGPVVTAPLNKEALHLAGYNYAGHTEIFATLTNTKEYTMMLWSEKISVVHVSTHVSLREACDLVKKDRIIECITLANDALSKLGVKNPKIAVAGLNPHSGESGLFGTEEIDEIIPAVNQMKEKGYNVEGPIPPDTVFLQTLQGKYDTVVAMYHDQGHIPLKLLAFDNGVNVTLGLPIIRTSVDHGTAFDIAGKGIAKEDSMLSAIKLAIHLGNENKN